MENSKKNQNSKSRLSSILDKYDDHLRQREEKKKQENTEREKFTEAFLKIRDEIIRPAFEKIKPDIEVRGHKVQIETKGPSWDSEKNIPIEPSISFILELVTSEDRQSRYHRSHDLPHLSFGCNSLEKKIQSHESTIGPGHGGHAGPKNEFTFDQITKELVEEELLDWLENLMKYASPSY